MKLSVFGIGAPAALLLIAAPLWAQPRPYTLQGQLGNKAPGKAYLRYGAGAAQKVDSAAITKGTFVFRGIVTDPTRATLFVVKPGQRLVNIRPIPTLDLYLEPGTIRVLSPDSLPHATVGGTPLNADRQKLTAALRPNAARMATIQAEYHAMTSQQERDTAFMAAWRRRLTAAGAEQKTVLRQFIRAMPQSPVSLAALDLYSGFELDPADVEPLYNGLAASVRGSKAGQQYAAQIALAQATAVGALAPDFTQADASGKLVSLRDFRGQYVLLDFWASWCGPCREENPNVVASYRQYQSRHFTVLGVSLDNAKGRSAWLKAIEADGLPWTQVCDFKDFNNEAAKIYSVKYIPQNFLVGPDGRIIAKNLRGEELGKKLAAVLPAK